MLWALKRISPVDRFNTHDTNVGIYPHDNPDIFGIQSKRAKTPYEDPPVFVFAFGRCSICIRREYRRVPLKRPLPGVRKYKGRIQLPFIRGFAARHLEHDEIFKDIRQDFVACADSADQYFFRRDVTKPFLSIGRGA